MNGIFRLIALTMGMSPLVSQATISMIAYDSVRDEYGVFLASCVPPLPPEFDLQRIVNHIVPGKGAITTQASVDIYHPEHGIGNFNLQAGISMIEEGGHSSQEIIDYLVAHDSHQTPEKRQYLVVQGTDAASYTGGDINESETGGTHEDISNSERSYGVSVAGNVVTQGTVSFVSQTYINQKDARMEDRILATLDALDKSEFKDVRCSEGNFTTSFVNIAGGVTHKQYHNTQSDETAPHRAAKTLLDKYVVGSVQFYKDKNYGHHLKTEEILWRNAESQENAQADLDSTSFNDEITSILIDGPVMVEMYEDKNFSSTKNVASQNIQEHKKLNDKISSYKVKALPKVEKFNTNQYASSTCLYEDSNFIGSSICLIEGVQESLPDIDGYNDQLSSVSFKQFSQPHIGVAIYKNSNFEGDVNHVEENILNLSDIGFNDNVSSARLFRK